MRIYIGIQLRNTFEKHFAHFLILDRDRIYFDEKQDEYDTESFRYP